ncbi:MAG: hypothetical protein IH856_22010 [Deltaproteobacteria bacterium]|nr:hypothetical protein [Deltaproteobacteria bacterium]
MTEYGPSMCPNTMLSLRNEIDRVIQVFQTPNEQAAALEELRATHPHSIQLATLERFCELPTGQVPKYDCFTFALDLIDCQERIAAWRFAPRNIGPVKRLGIEDALPGSSFLQFLCLPEQSSLQSCVDHDLVVYCDKFGNVQHAGKIVEASIVSKWGMKGSLWQHELWEVPSSYGTSARFYSHSTMERVRSRWLDYLRNLAQRVSGFTTLVSVMAESKGKNLTAEELLRLAAERTPRGL